MKISLRAARINLGYTRKAAAALFNIHYETLSNYEADSSNIPHSFFVKIESVYGISTDFIYFGKEQDHYAALLDQIALKEVMP